jgi:ribosomal protein S18 acetylase RimI-like enzyme
MRERAMIEELKQEQLKDVVRISDLVFGAGYLTEEDLSESLKLSTKDETTNAYIARMNGHTVGFAIAWAPGKWDISKGNCCAKLMWPEPDSKKAAYIRTVAVDPELQCKGIGTDLMNRLKERAKEQGADFAVGHVWLDHPDNASCKFMLRHKAVILGYCSNHWKRASEIRRWNCSRCGNPCYCNAGEFVISFDGPLQCKFCN